MKAEFYCLTVLLILINPIHNAAFDMNQVNKHATFMSLATCNKDSVVDLSLSPSSTITCDASDCTTV